MQSTSQSISAYITNTKAMSQSTARAYEYRLNAFDSFMSSKYHTNTDNLIKKVKEGHEDPYKVLSNYVSYLQGTRHISSLTCRSKRFSLVMWTCFRVFLRIPIRGLMYKCLTSIKILSIIIRSSSVKVELSLSVYIAK